MSLWSKNTFLYEVWFGIIHKLQFPFFFSFFLNSFSYRPRDIVLENSHVFPTDVCRVTSVMCSSSAGHSLSTPKVTGATRFRWCHDFWPSAKYLFVCVCEQETSVWSVMIWSTRTTCCCAVWTWCMETLSSAPTGRNSLTPPLKVNTHTHIVVYFLH